MRPKKVLLCVDPNPDRLGQTAFMLETAGYHVLRASTPPTAHALLSEMPESQPLISAYRSRVDIHGVLVWGEEFCNPRPYVPVILLSHMRATKGAARLVVPSGISAEELKVFLKLTLHTPRGPRKK